jgi:hypothetical protein
MFDHSLRKANISLGVFLVVLVAGTAAIGFDARDVEYQLVALIAFASGFVSLFTLYHREDRARERAEGHLGGRDANSRRPR